MAGGSQTVADRSSYEAIIEGVVQHTPDTRSLRLRLRSGRPFRFVPGQFISLQLPVDGEMLTRPYSIASDPETAQLLEICFNLVSGGRGSAYLFHLDVGATLHFTGPWGTFTLAEPPRAECVFVADETGIAPIRPMCRRALAGDQGGMVRLLYRAASEPRLLYSAEWEELAKRSRRFEFLPLLAPSPEALLDAVRHRYVTADEDRSRLFYICGVGETVTQLRDLLRRAGYARRAVQYEKW